MSGVVALARRDGAPADAMAVWTMLEAASHRGPDGSWIHLDGPVGLGYAKLAVTPEDVAARQPLVSPLTSCAVVADARLDNRRELLASLRGDWLVGQDAELPDAALILRAYEVWGEGGVSRLLGDFAFVVWDPRARRVVCARDSSGQRPLYYRVDGRAFAAAQEIQQLLQDPGVPVEPDEERLREFLVPANMLVNEKGTETTFFKGISALPAGCTLLLEDDRLAVVRHWHFQAPRELRYRDTDEYVAHFRGLLDEAVRARLRSAGPVGVMLSGGLDSSSVACAAQEVYRAGGSPQEVLDHGFMGFSSVFEGLECDERPLIEAVQRKYGFAVRYVPAAPLAGELELEPRGFRESPLTRPGLRDALFAHAQADGVRVLLTGDVADSCVRGSPLVFERLLLRGELSELRRRLGAYRRVSGESLHKILALYCAAPLLPLWLQRRVMAAYATRHIRRDRGLLPSWMPERLRESLRERHLALTTEVARERRFRSPARELDYRALWPPELARNPVGWPIEIWRPFADRRLQEFLLAVPPEEKFSPHPETDEPYAGSKRLLRLSMRGILPESIRARTAPTHFASAYEDQLERQWPAYERAFGPSAHSEIAARGYVDRDRFWARLQQLRRGARGRDFIYVMRMTAIESWLRMFALPREKRVALAQRGEMTPQRNVNYSYTPAGT